MKLKLSTFHMVHKHNSIIWFNRHHKFHKMCQSFQSFFRYTWVVYYIVIIVFLQKYSLISNNMKLNSVVFCTIPFFIIWSTIICKNIVKIPLQKHNVKFKNITSNKQYLCTTFFIHCNVVSPKTTC